MGLPRSDCALAGVAMLTALLALASPATSHARSPFNNGVTQAIDQIVDLIADGAEANEPRQDLRHLHNALEQLLRVLEGHGRAGHAHHGHMGKGAKSLNHHQKGGGRCGTVGANAGMKTKGVDQNGANKGPASKQGVGKLPGKNFAVSEKAPDIGSCDCRVKYGVTPLSGTAKRNGANGLVSRKPSTNFSNAGCAKSGIAPKSKALAANSQSGGKLSKSLQSNTQIGGGPGNRVNQQHVCAIRNNAGPQRNVNIAPANKNKTANTSGKQALTSAKSPPKTNVSVNQKQVAPLAAKKSVSASAFSPIRTTLSSRQIGAAVGNRPMANAFRRR